MGEGVPQQGELRLLREPWGPIRDHVLLQLLPVDRANRRQTIAWERIPEEHDRALRRRDGA